jgi:hypothetical protein
MDLLEVGFKKEVANSNHVGVEDQAGEAVVDTTIVWDGVGPITSWGQGLTWEEGLLLPWVGLTWDQGEECHPLLLPVEEEEVEEEEVETADHFAVAVEVEGISVR